MAQIKVNNAGFVNPKAINVWNGSSWVQKVGRVWNGAKWVDFIAYAKLVFSDSKDIKTIDGSFNVISDVVTDPSYSVEYFNLDKDLNYYVVNQYGYFFKCNSGNAKIWSVNMGSNRFRYIGVDNVNAVVYGSSMATENSGYYNLSDGLTATGKPSISRVIGSKGDLLFYGNRGSDGYLYNLSVKNVVTGVILTSADFPYTVSDGTVVVGDDGSYYLYGVGIDGWGELTRLDSNLNIIWQKRRSSDMYLKNVYSLQQLNGRIYIYGQDEWDYVRYVLDLAGNVVSKVTVVFNYALHEQLFVMSGVLYGLNCSYDYIYQYDNDFNIVASFPFVTGTTLKQCNTYVV